MPRSSEANAQIKDERRQEILFAALKLFSINGFDSTKIGDIAAEANISHGLIYHYFSSKDEVLGDLIRQSTASTIEFIQNAASLPFSVTEKLETIISELLARLNTPEQPQYSCMLMLDAIKSGQSAAQLPCLLLQYLISEGQQSGEIIQGDPESLGHTIFATLLGVAQFKCKLAKYETPEPAMILKLIKKD